jgi:hypothetical protein
MDTRSKTFPPCGSAAGGRENGDNGSERLFKMTILHLLSGRQTKNAEPKSLSRFRRDVSEYVTLYLAVLFKKKTPRRAVW